MNTYIVASILVFSIVCFMHTNCLPIGEEFSSDISQQAHVRVRRFTCDVLSVEAKGVKLNHAACGVHCLFRGRTGGYCNKKRVCVCR